MRSRRATRRRASQIVASLLLTGLLPTLAQAGAFIFADEGGAENSITHPNGYTGSGGPRVLSVCLRTAVLPVGVSATTVEATVLKAVATWNAQRVASANLGFGGANDIPTGEFDFESVLLHEMGHCVGLAHPNHASESGLPEPQSEGTKSTDGANNVFNQLPGSDGLHGSADDVRGDDGNLYWFRNGNGSDRNDPLAFPAIIDASTFTLALTSLSGTHLYARNGDRDVLNAMGVANTESVMQQGQFPDETQRRLTAEDLATIRLAASGLDETQGTSDDYTLALNYIGRTPNCNITVEFDPASSFASCSVGGQGINADHVRITTAELTFSPTTNWFYSQAPNTTTTITADTPDPSAPGASYSVSVAVAVSTAQPAGPPTGSVEIRDDLGNLCSAALASGSASCSLLGSVAGTRTLTATYLGLKGFDASIAAPATHSVGTSLATLTLSDAPATTVVGQSYTVSATVTGSSSTPTGTVGIVDGLGASCTITLSNGSGNCQLASTSIAAPLTLTGNYSGSNVYSPDSDTEPHSVNAAATSTGVLSRVPAATVVGQPYTVNVNVSAIAPGAGTPTGSVAVNDGNGATCSATLSAGAGSCVLTSSTAGNLSLAASYTGSPNFSASATTTAHSVGKANTALAILSDSPDASTPGQSVSVVFSLGAAAPGAGTPTGSVTITASGGAETCTATLPQTNCSLTLNQVGARVLTATYSGDVRFIASNDTDAHSVLGAGSVTSIVSDAPEPSRVGEPVTVNFSVAPQAPALGVPTGSVTVSASGGSESCTATLPTTSCLLTLTSAGVRTLAASYGGDANFGSSNDTEPHQVLAAATTATVASVLPEPSLVTQPYTVAVSVVANAPGAGTPSGNVSVSDGVGGNCSAGLVAGSMSCTITPSAAGARTLTATYAGNANFETSNASAPHRVRAATQLVIASITPAPTAIGESATVSITIATDPALAAPSGTLTISTDREAATCQIVLPQTACGLALSVIGIHRVRAAYPGDADYSATQAEVNHRAVAAGTIFLDGFEAL